MSILSIVLSSWRLKEFSVLFSMPFSLKINHTKEISKMKHYGLWFLSRIIYAHWAKMSDMVPLIKTWLRYWNIYGLQQFWYVSTRCISYLIWAFLTHILLTRKLYMVHKLSKVNSHDVLERKSKTGHRRTGCRDTENFNC